MRATPTISSTTIAAGNVTLRRGPPELLRLEELARAALATLRVELDAGFPGSLDGRLGGGLEGGMAPPG
jgi:hypothetical protein